MKTVLTYILFSALVSLNPADKETPKLEDDKIIKDLNKAELTDWTIGSIREDLYENTKAELLPAPKLEALLNAKEEQLDDKCYENINLQFYTLDQKEEVKETLTNYLNDRALVFPKAPSIYENEKYILLVWKPFCLSDENYEDERVEKLVTSLEKKLKLKQTN